MTKLQQFFIILLFSAISFGASGQNVLRGKVLDQHSKEAIIGASVVVKSTTEGTSTDSNGDFTLSTRQTFPLTVVVRFLGYQSQEIKVNNTQTLEITLREDVNTLDEVVVTAGGIFRAKREQGYSTTKITNEELTAGKSPSFAGGLTAKIPGLQVNAITSGVNPNYRLVLRGNRSITGNNQALIVVDNAIVSNDFLNSLNPEDIEDIQVLNGASGATLYGSEASNGVLLVTTKKGSKGRPQIKFSHTTTFEQVNFFPKLQTRFGQGSIADGQVFDPVENQQYGPAFDGSIRDLGYPLENGDQQQTAYKNVDERQKFWETGVQNQTDLSFSFGSDKSTSYIAAQYLNAIGTTPGDKYNRISVRLNNTQQILPNLNLTYNANYVEGNYDITTATGTIYDQLQNVAANVPITSYKNWQTDKWSDPEGWFNPWYRNPYWTAANYREEGKNSYLTGKAEIKWDVRPWLSVLYRGALSNRYFQTEKHTEKLTLSDYARKTQGKANLTGYIYERGYNKYRFNQDFLVSLNKRLDDFSFNLILGASNVNNSFKNTTYNASGLVIPGLFNISNRSGDAGLPTEGKETAAIAANVADANDYNRNYHTLNYGFWGDLVVGYKNYLFLHVTGRNDWTSVLSPENRSYFYPSTDISFVPTDAIASLKDNPVLDYLKIRGAISKTGNVNIDAYSLVAPYESVSGYSTGTYFRESNNLVSSDLKPEITIEKEIGTEFRLFKNLVEVQLTYYKTNTTGQAIYSGIAPSSGYSIYLLNIGEVTNEGVESALRLNPVRTKDWDLHLGVNHTHNKNFLKSLHPDTKRIAVNGSSVIFAEEGYELNQIIVTDYKRDDQGRVVVDINTGYPSTATETAHLGNTTPKDRLGLDFSLRWKDFTLSSVFEYRGGYYYAYTSGATMDFTGSSARTAYYNRERFVFPNSSYWDEASGQYVANTNITISDGGAGFWTSATYNRTGAYSNYVYSGNYWKWREIALSYQLPRTFLRNLTNGAIQNASISLQGRNLFLWTPESNEYTDPDFSANDNNAIGVSTFNVSPPTRYVGGSISLTF